MSPGRETQTLSGGGEAQVRFAAMIRWLAFASLGALLAGCGSSGDAAPAPPPAASVSVSGQITFDRVPAVAGQGLVYSQTVAKPIQR